MNRACYVVAVKAGQPTLDRDVTEYFRKQAQGGLPHFEHLPGYALHCVRYRRHWSPGMGIANRLNRVSECAIRQNEPRLNHRSFTRRSTESNPLIVSILRRDHHPGHGSEPGDKQGAATDLAGITRFFAPRALILK